MITSNQNEQVKYWASLNEKKNRDKYNAYQRAYRAKKKAASGAGTSESSKGNKSTSILTV